MKVNFHKLLNVGKLLFLTFFVIILTGCFGESKITEAEIQAIIAQSDSAAQKKDVEGICANLSEKIQIKLAVEAAGQRQNFTLTREQYQDLLKKAFAVTSNYNYTRKNTNVKISNDGKSASVMDETTESATVNGQVIKTVSAEASIWKRENGKLVIIYLDVAGKQL